MLEKGIIVPDLSLQISPPKSNQSPSVDIWPQQMQVQQVDTELSLSNNSTSAIDVSTDRFRPIRGIPVYNNGLLSSSRYFNRNQQPTTSSSSMSPPPCLSFRAFQQQQDQAVGRYNGITMEGLRNQEQNFNHQNQNHQFVFQNQQSLHFGVSDFSSNYSNNRSRSLLMPRIQSRRNARAPRMRWTSSLHARFIRAVELLGGHESTFYLALSPFRSFIKSQLKLKSLITNSSCRVKTQEFKLKCDWKVVQPAITYINWWVNDVGYWTEILVFFFLFFLSLVGFNNMQYIVECEISYWSIYLLSLYCLNWQIELIW